MAKRKDAGRGLFYTRDSGGRHETTPGEYVLWARKTVAHHGLTFDGTPARIEAMIRDGRCREGDLFLDYGVTGNKLTRDGMDALIEEALKDEEVSHLLIPRRDRLARPDDPLDGMKLERCLREAGLTLVFMDRVLRPMTKGHRADLGELIAAMVDYNHAGEFRRDLAQKMIHAQTALAKAGYSTGGRPPYGFRRWLVRLDGTPVRELSEGEHVRMAGHHVAWLPGPEGELGVIHRILSMLETMPASRVAATLTSEGIPAPDTGRRRTDRGVNHATSGVWHQPTIVNIARNPLLIAVVSYGKRSMGDQLRFSPEGPRPLEEDDRRTDGQPKVVANRESDRIRVAARFDPLVDESRQSRLLETLDARAGTQRGKPRSIDPAGNPLGARVFDLACGWPLYRQPYNGSFRYLCGLYQQSHGASCSHNQVAGPSATQFLLNCIRQRILTPSFRERLKQRLEAIAKCELGAARPDSVVEALRSALVEARRKREKAAENLALAQGPGQFEAIAAVFESLSRKENRLQAELEEVERVSATPVDLAKEVEAALTTADRLAEMEPDAGDFAAAGELFRALNVRLFLGFEEVKPKKRTLNVVSKGVVTFGMAPAPVALYEGPTGRRALKAEQSPEACSGRTCVTTDEEVPARGGKSLGNVSRGERI